jgi:hypothetical protein
VAQLFSLGIVRAMNPIVKRVVVGIAGLACLAVLAFVGLIVYVMMPPFRSYSRMHEKLPSVSIENGDTVYCRMRYCDFRFPLPDKAHIVNIDPVTGGADTINGAIYLIGPDGGPVKMRAYAELLQKKHFDAAPCDGSGCPDVTNHMADVPFVSDGKVIHYPLFDDFWAGSSNQVGGSIEVVRLDGMTKIRFGYFGDY